MNTALINFAISLVTLLVGVAFLEAAIRILDLAPSLSESTSASGLEAILQFDATRESTYRPNSQVQIVSPQSEFSVTYRTNRLGLRDRDVPTSDAPAEIRILVVGNSFVEGWGVEAEQTFLRVAEDRLNKQRPPERRVRMINAGQSGYGAAQSYLNAQALTPTMQPEEILFVLIGTMVHADAKFLANAATTSEEIATGLSVDMLLNGGTTPQAPKQQTNAIVAGLNEFSALSRFVTQRLANLSAINAIIAGDPNVDLLAAYRPLENDGAAIYEPTFRHIRALADYAADNDLGFSLLHLPMPFQLSEIEWDVGREAYKLEGPSTGKDEQALVEKFCVTEKLKCIFADDALRDQVAQNPDDRRLFYRYDFHLNASGNHKLGVWLAEQRQ